MSNRVAIGLVVILACAYGAATLLFDEPVVFLGRKFLELLSWLAFWR